MIATRYNEESMSIKGQRLRLNEHGMASFMITLIMILVISLIVLGFSQVTRRNQREALDRQLSSEAFYAAESGINVTTHTIAGYLADNPGATLPTKTTCSHEYDPTKTDGVGGEITPLDGEGGGITYTCVLVNPNPPSLLASPTTSNSVVLPISSPHALAWLKFQWPKTAADTGAGCGSTQVFPAQGSWTCGAGVLRVDLMKVSNTTITSAADFSSNTVTLFLTPMGSPTTPDVSFGGTTTSYIISASNCSGSGPGPCSATIDFTGDNSAAQYYARLSMIYRNLDAAHPVSVTGGTTDGPATFNSQAIVDVTGKAQDELRRIQARVNLSSTPDGSTIPLNAIASSESICKDFKLLSTDPVPANTCPQ